MNLPYKSWQLTGRPDAAFGLGHVSKVTDEKAVIVRLLALQSDASTTPAAGRDDLGGIGPQNDGAAVGDLVEAELVGIFPRLVANETIGEIVAVEPVESGKERLPRIGSNEVVSHFERENESIRKVRNVVALGP